MSADDLASMREQRPVRRPGYDGPLTPQEAFLLSQADGKLTVAELQHVVPFPPAELAGMLQVLLDREALEWLAGESRGPRASRRGETLAETAAEPPAAAPVAEQPEPEDEEVVRLRRRTRLTRRLIDRGDPFELFGLKPGCTDDEVRDAFRRLSRQFHPDRFYSLELTAEDRRELDDVYGEIQNAYSRIAQRDQRRELLRKRHGVGTRETGSNGTGGADGSRLAELAREAIGRRQYASAVTNLRMAHQLDPSSGHGKSAKLVELLEKVDQRVSALTDSSEMPDADDVATLTATIAKIKDILPPVPRLLRDLTVFLYLHSPDFPLCREILGILLREHRSVDNLILGARVYLKGGLPQTAHDLLDEARASAPDHPDIKALTREVKRRGG